MAPRRRADAVDFAKMRARGMEFDPPVDEFSEQPGSGSAIGGRRGEQEYGIVGGVAQEEAHDRSLASNVDANPADLESDGKEFRREVMDRNSPGVSQYSAAHIEAIEDLEGGTDEDRDEPYPEREQDMSLSELEGLLRERLARHPELERFAIEARLEDFASVTLEGKVRTESERLLAQEIAEAVVASAAIDNRIIVDEEMVAQP